MVSETKQHRKLSCNPLQQDQEFCDSVALLLRAQPFANINRCGTFSKCLPVYACIMDLDGRSKITFTSLLTGIS